jgi:hypothetical protein
MYKINDKHIIVILVILFLFIAIPRLKYPDFDHGDEFSDAELMVSGENFVKFGFIKLRFLPMHEINADKPGSLYTHYPPLHNIINGALRMVFKTDSLYFFRSFALLFSLLNVIFWYLIIRKLTNSYFAGFLCSIFYFTNPLFIYSSDGIHQLAYSDFLRSLILFCFLKLLDFREQKQKRIILTLFLMALIIAESLTTFEYIFYLSLFFVLFRYFFKIPKGSLSFGIIFLLLLAPVIGFLLHFAQNAWYFGSAPAAIQDLKNIALERITHSKDSSMTLNLYTWWKYVILRNFSLVFLFNYYLLFPFMLFSHLLYYNLSSESKEKIKPLLRLTILLTLCGITWYAVFPSHSLAHTFVLFLSRHLVPVASLAFTLICYIIFTFIKDKNPRNIFAKIPLIIIIITIISAGISKSELPVTPENIARANDFLIFKKSLLKLKEISHEKDDFGVNYYRFPFIRYYVHRPCMVIFDKPTLENKPNLPRYFIFFPYNDQRNAELFKFIVQKYDFLFQCNSFRFPAFFYELKK